MLGNGTSVGARPRQPDNIKVVESRIEDVKR